ncbi:sugar ABC transporter permease [Nonomuraea sp. NPDC049141]|uniref:carbohydrate ABC transporter permease n=1 Tax=Nonomuraea sp. NPDC049141 TaxID=3155500 RepID=UPI0033FA8C93
MTTPGSTSEPVTPESQNENDLMQSYSWLRSHQQGVVSTPVHSEERSLAHEDPSQAACPGGRGGAVARSHRLRPGGAFALLYTALITPFLIIGGYLLALLTARNTALRRVTRTVVFIPVVIGLGVSSLLWYWLFSTDFGLVNRALLDLGIIDKPVLWLGVDAGVSNFAISASVVWKVIGFGMILFVAAIQAVPTDVVEAALVDGASPRLMSGAVK